MAGKDFEELLVSGELSNPRDIAQLNQLTDKLTRLFKDLVANGEAFNTAVKRGKDSFTQSFYVSKQYADQARKALEYSVGRKDAEGNPLPPAATISSGGSVEYETYRKKILSDKNALSAIKAEAGRYGGSVSSTSSDMYYDISIPSVVRKEIDKRINAANSATRKRMERSIEEYTPESMALLNEKNLSGDAKDRALAEAYKRSLSAMAERAKIASEKPKPVGLSREEKREFTEKYLPGAMHNISSSGLTDDEKADAEEIAYKRAVRQRNKSLSKVAEGGEKGELTKNEMSTIKTLGVLYIIQTLLRKAVDIAQKIFDVVSMMPSKALQNTIDASRLGTSAISMYRFGNAEIAKGMPEGTIRNALQTIVDKFGQPSKLDKEALGQLARVLGPGVVDVVKSGLGGKDPTALADIIIKGFQEKIDSGKSLEGVSMDRSSLMRYYLGYINQALGGEWATILANMEVDRTNFGRPELRKDASGKFSTWATGQEAVVNPSGFTQTDSNNLAEMARYLNEIKAIISGLLDGIKASLTVIFTPIMEFVRSSLRTFMTPEAAAADAERARAENRAKIPDVQSALDMNKLEYSAKQKDVEEAFSDSGKRMYPAQIDALVNRVAKGNMTNADRDLFIGPQGKVLAEKVSSLVGTKMAGGNLTSLLDDLNKQVSSDNPAWIFRTVSSETSKGYREALKKLWFGDVTGTVGLNNSLSVGTWPMVDNVHRDYADLSEASRRASDMSTAQAAARAIYDSYVKGGGTGVAKIEVVSSAKDQYIHFILEDTKGNKLAQIDRANPLGSDVHSILPVDGWKNLSGGGYTVPNKTPEGF